MKPADKRLYKSLKQELWTHSFEYIWRVLGKMTHDYHNYGTYMPNEIVGNILEVTRVWLYGYLNIFTKEYPICIQLSNISKKIDEVYFYCFKLVKERCFKTEDKLILEMLVSKYPSDELRQTYSGVGIQMTDILCQIKLFYFLVKLNLKILNEND